MVKPEQLKGVLEQLQQQQQTQQQQQQAQAQPTAQQPQVGFPLGFRSRCCLVQAASVPQPQHFGIYRAVWTRFSNAVFRSCRATANATTVHATPLCATRLFFNGLVQCLCRATRSNRSATSGVVAKSTKPPLSAPAERSGQVAALTPAEIDSLPPAQREQVMTIRRQLNL